MGILDRTIRTILGSPLSGSSGGGGGGGGSPSVGVVGSVQFSDGAGAFSSNDTKFFWDDAGEGLRIGTDTVLQAESLTIVTTGPSGWTALSAMNTVIGGFFISAQNISSDVFSIGSQSNHRLQFFANAGAYMTLQHDSQFIGINKDDPYGPLDIKIDNDADIVFNFGGTNPNAAAINAINAANTLNIPLEIRSSSLELIGQIVSGVADPVAAQDVATKNYVDSVVTGGGFPLLAPVASAAAPSYSFSNLPDAGFWAPNTNDQIDLAFGGTNRILFSASGIFPATNHVTVLGASGFAWANVSTEYIDIAYSGGARFTSGIGQSNTIRGSATGTAYTIELPSNAGTAGQVLTAQGGGLTEWTTAGTPAGAANSIQYKNGSAFGGSTIIFDSGNDSYAFHGSTASGGTSFAVGSTTTASGQRAASFGSNSTASGSRSFSSGDSTVSSGINSFTMGLGTTAQGFAQLAVGEYNVLQGTSGSTVTTDEAFIIGNGASAGARHNSFSVTKDGIVKLYGTTSGFVGFRGAAVAGSTTYTYPSDGTSGQVLSTNGSGVLSWITPSSGITWATPINSNLIPDTGGVYNLGSGSFAFSQLFVTQIFTNTGNSLAITGDAGTTYDAGTGAHDFTGINNGLIVPRLSSDPGGPTNGEIWYNTTSNQLKARVNGATVVLA